MIYPTFGALNMKDLKILVCKGLWLRGIGTRSHNSGGGSQKFTPYLEMVLIQKVNPNKNLNS